MSSAKVDYSLYLVTDSTEAILGSRGLVDVVEQALAGGSYLCEPFAGEIWRPRRSSASYTYELTFYRGDHSTIQRQNL